MPATALKLRRSLRRVQAFYFDEEASRLEVVTLIWRRQIPAALTFKFIGRFMSVSDGRSRSERLSILGYSVPPAIRALASYHEPRYSDS